MNVKYHDRMTPWNKQSTYREYNWRKLERGSLPKEGTKVYVLTDSGHVERATVSMGAFHTPVFTVNRYGAEYPLPENVTHWATHARVYHYGKEEKEDDK